MKKLKEVKVGDILYEKAPPLVRETDTLAHARNVGIRTRRKTIVVVDEDGRPIGIIDMRDIGRKILDKPNYARPLDRLLVKDFMDREILTVSEGDYVVDTAKRILENRKEVIVLGEDDQVYGVIEAEDLLGPYSRLSRSETLVRDVYIREPPTASPLHSIKYAYELMEEKDLDAVIVVDQVRRPVGIVTYSDIIYLPITSISRGSRYVKDSTRRVVFVKYSLPVLEDIMSSPVFVASPDELLVDVAGRMYFERIGHLPVIDEENTIIGLIDKYIILEDMVRTGL